MRALLMTNAVRAEIARAIAEARKTPLPADLLMEIAKGTPQEKATLVLADRKPDFVRPESQHVLIGVGYRASISFEEQPAGLVRHLSISVDGKPGALPNVPAIMALAAEFGLPGGLEDWKVWIEEYEPGQFAVNIVALDPGQPARTMQ
jgi:hypothetical protein